MTRHLLPLILIAALIGLVTSNLAAEPRMDTRDYVKGQKIYEIKPMPIGDVFARVPVSKKKAHRPMQRPPTVDQIALYLPPTLPRRK